MTAWKGLMEDNSTPLKKVPQFVQISSTSCFREDDQTVQENILALDVDGNVWEYAPFGGWHPLGMYDLSDKPTLTALKNRRKK